MRHFKISLLLGFASFVTCVVASQILKEDPLGSEQISSVELKPQNQTINKDNTAGTETLTQDYPGSTADKENL